MLTRPKLITVTGQPGAGKTTACTALAAELGWEYFYTGLVMRRLGEEMGLTVTEVNAAAETNPEIDRRVDAVYVELESSGKPLVVDARLGWYFLPRSFKVMFHVPVEVGAARVLLAQKRVGEEYRDIQSAVQLMTARRESERVKHRNSYGIIDDGDFAHFDLVLDTSYSSPDRNVSFVRAAYWLWHKGIRLPKIWLSPKSLYPTRGAEFLVPASVSLIKDNITATGFDTLQPIKVYRAHEQFYIIDGHHRVAAAIRAEVDFLPVVVVEHNEEPSLEENALSSWERVNHFSFPVQPKLLKSTK